jgi:hypothetical protein
LRTKGLKKGILSTFIDAIPQNHGVKLLQSMNYDQLKSMTDIKKEFFPASPEHRRSQDREAFVPTGDCSKIDFVRVGKI